MQLKEASVLLVDDESVLLDLMREWLQQLVGTVFCAGDGVQALQVLDTHRVDLVITDIRMPVMNGIALLKEMKARGRCAPSLIFITGFADIEVRDAYDLGAEALVEKPVVHDGLIEIMQRSLSEPPERWKKNWTSLLRRFSAELIRVCLPRSKSSGLPSVVGAFALRTVTSQRKSRSTSP